MTIRCSIDGCIYLGFVCFVQVSHGSNLLLICLCLLMCPGFACGSCVSCVVDVSVLFMYFVCC